MDKKEIKRSIFIAALAVAVCVTVQNFAVIAQVFMIALNALKPLIIGCIIAYIFNIIMNSFEKHYFPKSTSHKIEITRRPVCLVASFAITVAIIVLILYIVIPELAGAISVLYDEIPSQLVKLKDFVAKELQQYPEIQQKISDFNVDWSSIVEKATNLLTTGVTGILSSAVGIIGGLTMTVTNLILGFVFAAYLLLRKDKLYTDVKRIMTIAFSERSNRKIRRIYHTAHDTFRSFFVGQFVEAIILGSLCFVGMTILKLPYAGMSGTLVGITALIPIVGAFIGAGISAFMILTENPMQALIFLIFLIILQQVEGNLIYPKVVGSSIGLPGVWVLAAVTVGGGLFGILGMLLGVPLAATIYKLCFEKLERREKELGITSTKTETPAQKTPKKSKIPVSKSQKKK